MADQIILRERTFTIKAGDTFDQALHGNVLRVTAGAVPLRVQSRDGQLDFTILSGEKAKFPDDNPALILSHASGIDQQFTIQVGKGVDVASALLSGSVVISGTPTVINGGGTLTSISNTVKVTNDGAAYGAAFKSSATLASLTPETVVTPGANVSGILVHAAAHVTYSSVFVALLAKSSAPSGSLLDGDVILHPGAYQSNGVGGNDLKNPIIIPAGKGLYFMSQSAETAGSVHRSVLYTLR